MPPASLSTFAVMIPGPRIARKSVSATLPVADVGARSGCLGGRRDHLSLRRCRSRLRLEPVDDVVDRDDADEDPFGIRHGQGEEVVLGHRLGDLVGRDVRRDGPHGSRHGALEKRVVVGGEDVAHGERAQDALLLVDDVEVEERLGVAGDGPEALEGLAHGESRRERDEVRPHEAARRVLVVHEQLGHLFGRALFHELDEVPGVLALDLAEDVGRLVGRHLLEDLRSAPLGQVLDDLRLHLGLQLVQRLGRRLDLQLLEDPGSLGARHLAQDVRDVGRMEPLELLLRHAWSRGARGARGAAASSPTG